MSCGEQGGGGRLAGWIPCGVRVDWPLSLDSYSSLLSLYLFILFIPHYHTALEKLLGFSLEKCLMKVWQNTDLFCGGSHGIPADERLRVKRPYGRVDRVVRRGGVILFAGGVWKTTRSGFFFYYTGWKAWSSLVVLPFFRTPPPPFSAQMTIHPVLTPYTLLPPQPTPPPQALKEELRSRALEGGAVLLPTAVDASSVVHSKEGSQLRLQDGTQVKTRFLLDCSGYQSTLVKLDGVHNPGVQVCTWRCGGAREERGRKGRREQKGGGGGT